MAKKSGLGRGLDALFADLAPISEEEYNASAGTEEPAGAEAAARKSGSGRKSAKSAAKAAADDTEDRVLYIDINDIKPNIAQPRKVFDESKLEELAGSIRTNGVIQPLIVRKTSTGSGFELVAGERRWRASRLAGLRTVPCIIRD